ncbi:MAG: AraC family transcriptional regulator [Bacteroidales bacterium]|nr:AraC family transcriptional regulator [Bacteroidales bacterium]
MYCLETDASKILRTNLLHGFLSCYAFMLVDKGWMTIHYNGRELTLNPNDLYTYSPCLPVTVTATSDDFHGYCLMADEHAAVDAPVLHDLAHIATLPFVQLREPKQTLPDDAARHIAEKMCEIIHYQHSDHIYKAEVSRMLYAIFLLDLQNIQDQTIARRQLSPRVEEIFIGFLRLLPDNFIEHRDIQFYASRLCISPVYLSRVVRQVSRRTVIDYINHMLLVEACFLLRTSKLSIAQISDRLHFADTPSFSKFFSRMKGLSPRAYREKYVNFVREIGI